MCNCSLCCLSFRISVEISRVKATILLRLLNKIATTTKVQFNCIWTILFVVAVRVASSTRRTTFLFNCELQRQHHYYHPAVPSLYCVLCIDAGNRHLLIRAGHQQNCSKQQNRINIVLWNEMTFWIIKQTFAFGEFCAFSSGCVRTDTRASVCVSFALQVCVSETEAVDRECESARAFISFLHHLIWHILWALNRGRRCRLSPPQVRTWNAVCCICVCHWNFLLSLFLWVVRNTHWTLCVYIYIYICLSETVWANALCGVPLCMVALCCCGQVLCFSGPLHPMNVVAADYLFYFLLLLLSLLLMLLLFCPPVSVLLEWQQSHTDTTQRICKTICAVSGAQPQRTLHINVHECVRFRVRWTLWLVPKVCCVCCVIRYDNCHHSTMMMIMMIISQPEIQRWSSFCLCVRKVENEISNGS